MIKYKDTYVVFEEIPDKITLAINITNCQNRCVGCHSPELRCDIGTELTNEEIDKLIKENDGVNCVCLMGEGNDYERVAEIGSYIIEKYPNIETAVYSGREEVDKRYLGCFDYIKIGPYKEEFGPLNSRMTNQRLLHYNIPRSWIASAWFMEDITYKFWRRK